MTMSQVCHRCANYDVTGVLMMMLSQVLVLHSIRRPKRITLRGNDEKEYRYLVKCGEDLRQDERIEQLLDLMNDIYSRHAACRQKHLRLRTYQVVPMTPRYAYSFQSFNAAGWASSDGTCCL